MTFIFHCSSSLLNSPSVSTCRGMQSALCLTGPVFNSPSVSTCRGMQSVLCLTGPVFLLKLSICFHLQRHAVSSMFNWTCVELSNCSTCRGMQSVLCLTGPVFNSPSVSTCRGMQSGGGQELAGTLANLDAMFGEDRLWNRVKNYVVTWQLFTEYMIEYSHIIDGNDCNIPTFGFLFPTV